MKKNYLKIISSFLVSLLVMTGCQKQINEPPVPAATNPQIEESQSRIDQHGNNNECRLVFATNTDPTYSQDFRFHYNHKGLADKWDIVNYGRFTQEYDHSGKVKKSIHTVDGVVIFTIHFFYNGNKLVKEILYYGTGTNIMDEAFYTFNVHGKLIKVQSFINDYVAITKYNAEGNVKSSELIFSGIPIYSLSFKYNKHFKNPYLAIPGIDHGFPYYTPSDFFYSKWQFASLKQLAYDENGDPIVYLSMTLRKPGGRKGNRTIPAKLPILIC